jgi:hypothetical protein
MLKLLPALALAPVLLVAGSASASPRHFKNCTAVHKVYKHGIAKSRSAAAHANGLTGRPKISKSLYLANKRLDRDKDGVACEK